jgi:hypothetical protein
MHNMSAEEKGYCKDYASNKRGLMTEQNCGLHQYILTYEIQCGSFRQRTLHDDASVG